MLGGLIGILCCGELLTMKSGVELLKWTVRLSGIVFILFNLTLLLGSHSLGIVVTGLFGLTTAPIFMLAYE